MHSKCRVFVCGPCLNNMPFFCFKYIHIYIYIYMYMYMYMYIYIHIYMYIHIYSHVYTYIYTYTCMYVHMYTYMYIYVHIYTKWHIPRSLSPRFSEHLRYIPHRGLRLLSHTKLPVCPGVSEARASGRCGRLGNAA